MFKKMLRLREGISKAFIVTAPSSKKQNDKTAHIFQAIHEFKSNVVLQSCGEK